VKKRKAAFASEAEMCSAFISVLPDGWTAYPETEGWDILLVRAPDGLQIGVQAKLRLNVDVINQTIEDRWYLMSPGPDHRAVLVPGFGASGFGKIADYIGITVISVRASTFTHGPRYDIHPALPAPGDSGRPGDWPQAGHVARYRLPDYVPDVPAGAAAPVRLTAWKVKAIKLCILMERRGFVTRGDFRHLDLDHRRWLPSGAGFLKTAPDGRYVRGDFMPDYRKAHPRNFEEIAADYEKWAPPERVG
jgi:hypothetical protein